MISRNDVINEAIDKCMKELYSYVIPKISWKDFLKENKEYNKKYKKCEKFIKLFNRRDKLTEDELKEYSTFPKDWEGKSITECIGPKPFEFYYLPQEILKEIADSYIYAYELDKHQNLLDIIEILKKYCDDPIVSKWIKHNNEPGYKGYEHIDNLKTELAKMFSSLKVDSQKLAESINNKFFEFLDKAGNFYSWNNGLNTFITNVYLGGSPTSDKQTVIDNWKKYRNKDIEIDEIKMKNDYYGEE